MAHGNRKINKKRRTRSCGYGNAKKHRGAGSRGGRGNAGSSKHHAVKMRILYGNYLGKTGFKRHRSIITRYSTINVGDIEKKFSSLLEAGVLKKSGSKYSIDLSELNIEKVLGAGELSHPIEVKAHTFSAKAIQKIEGAGGKVISELPTNDPSAESSDGADDSG